MHFRVRSVGIILLSRWANKNKLVYNLTAVVVTFLEFLHPRDGHTIYASPKSNWPTHAYLIHYR